MAEALTTADSSVVVPALSQAHPLHQRARAALADVETLPAHVQVEALAVLTRLPGGLALSPETALTLMRSRFQDEPLVLSPSQHSRLLNDVARAGLRGGQLYDALVGGTARVHGARLVTSDARALPTYRAVGVDVALLG